MPARLIRRHRLATAALGTAFVTMSHPAPAGLVGYWNFDGPPAAAPADRLRDLSGNRYHGTDPNAANTSRVLFNNTDIPPVASSGGENYCLDLSGADRCVIMNGTAADAIDTRGAALNIGNVAWPATNPAGRLTVSFWYKGNAAVASGPFVSKGGDAYATAGTPGGTEGWAVRRASSTSNFAWVTRGFGANAGEFYTGGSSTDNGAVAPLAKSGGTLVAPTVSNVNFSTNNVGGIWQHAAMVWDGRWKHTYINGVQVKSEDLGSGTATGSRARLVLGGEENPNLNGGAGALVAGRFSRVRMDEVAIFDEPLTAAQIEDLARGADPRRLLRSQWRPFNFSWPSILPTNAANQGLAAGQPPLPEGGPGYIGLLEMRPAGTLKRPDGTTTGSNATIGSPHDALLFARWGSSTAAVIGRRTGTAPLLTSIDFQDPNTSTGTGSNGAGTTYLTDSAADDNNFFQMAQGCFRVAAPGRFTFQFRGDDGAQLSIAGATWVQLFSSNGTASFSGETLQNGYPTGDTNTLAVVEFPAAGDYNFRYLWNEQAGGAWNEVWYAPGERAAYDAANFRPLGNAAGGLTLVDHVPMVDLRASALTVSAGVPASITLSWDAAYATSVTLNGGSFASQNVTASTVNGIGSITFASPATTTTYTLTAVRGSGTPVARSLTIRVDEPAAVASFTADDATLVAGAPMTLRWQVTPGATLSLTDGTSTWNVTANTSAVSGIGAISSLPAPASSRTFTLTASNSFGSAQATIPITIGSPPVIQSFTVADAFIRPEGTATLSWNVTGADSATLSPDLGPVTLPTGTACGNPLVSTTYQLTAVNTFGSSTASAAVQIAEPLGISPALWTVKQALANTTTVGNLDNLTKADQILEAPDGSTLLRQNSATVTGVDFIDYSDGASGLFGFNRTPPLGAAIDHFAVRCSATLLVNQTGSYTFGINNDDGGRLLIDLNRDGDFYLNPANRIFNPTTSIYDAGEGVIIDNTNHAPTTFTGTVTLTPGTYAIEYTFFEQGGGMAGEVFSYRNGQPLLLAFTPAQPPITGPDLAISEILTDNVTGIRDGEGDREDWIEIHNPTAAAIDLQNYWLSDDPLVPDKWRFPAFSLAAGRYFVVFASAKNRTVGTSEFHTNFRLSQEGEHLGLYKSNGAGGFTMVSGWLPSYPPQYSDRSWGRYDSEGYIGFFVTATPGDINNGGYEGFAPDIKFSVDRGLYTAPQTVALTIDPAAPDPQLFQIRWTIDGSEPTASNGSLYTAPLTVSRTTALRAAAVRKGWKTADIDTHTYLFLDDVLTQTPATATAIGFPAGSVNGQVYRYGMNSAVVQAQPAAVRSALACIPSLCITVPQSEFTHPVNGIYSNPNRRGDEAPASAELLNENGQGLGHFQIDCGLRVRGGFSRDPNNPKHALRLFFNNDYDGALNYPVFQNEGASRFENLDLRTAQNYSWAYQNDTRNTFLREELSRDLQGATGQPYSRCRYLHVYINGIYWGLYDTDERFEEAFGETYLGGDEDNYDVIKSAGNAANYTTEATEGFLDAIPPGAVPRPGDAAWSTTQAAWRVLWNKVRAARATPATGDAVFWEIQGLQPDGRTPLAGNPPPLLDVDNLIDYLLVTFYCGSFDAPLSTFLNNASNNWFGIRNPETRRGFVFKVHDFEHGMGADRDWRSFDRTGPWGGTGTQTNAYNSLPSTDPLFVFRKQASWSTTYNTAGDFARSNPQYLHEDLAFASLEYRTRFQDRVQRHFFNGGALTDASVLARLNARRTTVDCAIVAEQARWGNTSNLTKAAWQTEVQYLIDWINRGSNAGTPLTTNQGRGNTIVTLLRGYRDGGLDRALAAPIAAPVYSQFGGQVPSGFSLTMSIPAPNSPAGTIYYTTNGEDPRAPGGAINTARGALAYSGPITLTVSGPVRARVWNGTQWSGIVDASFLVGTPASSANLVITEINYNPLLTGPGTPNAIDGAQSFEFIELQNISTGPIDLTGVEFDLGIVYTFPIGRVLTAGERIVVAKDPIAFASRYPDTGYPELSTRTVGPFTGSLANTGEQIVLRAANGQVIRDFIFSDNAPWPTTPDGNNGNGATLVFTTASPATADAADPLNWFGHAVTYGNPGGPDTGSYAAWAAANSASTNGSTDTDGDGLTDLTEYFLGTLPNNPGSRSGTTAGTAVIPPGGPDTFLTLTVTRAPQTQDVRPVVETSTSLAPGAWAPDAVLVSRFVQPDGSEILTWRSPQPFTGPGRQFMRLRVLTAP